LSWRLVVVREPPGESGITVGSQGLVRLAVRAAPGGTCPSPGDLYCCSLGL